MNDCSTGVLSFDDLEFFLKKALFQHNLFYNRQTIVMDPPHSVTQLSFFMVQIFSNLVPTVILSPTFICVLLLPHISHITTASTIYNIYNILI